MKTAELNYNYIKKLAIFLKKANLQDLFIALVLNEKYSLVDDLRILTRKEIREANKNYMKYLKSRDTLVNRRWLF